MSELFSRSMQSRIEISRLSTYPSYGRRIQSPESAAIQRLSRHARERMREHRLSFDHLVLIVRYGVYHRARHDRNAYDVPDSPFLCLIHPLLPLVRNIALVIADDGTVVSVYQKDSRFREGVLK